MLGTPIWLGQPDTAVQLVAEGPPEAGRPQTLIAAL
jgi:hypothetical protein